MNILIIPVMKTCEKWMNWDHNFVKYIGLLLFLKLIYFSKLQTIDMFDPNGLFFTLIV